MVELSNRGRSWGKDFMDPWSTVMSKKKCFMNSDHINVNYFKIEPKTKVYNLPYLIRKQLFLVDNRCEDCTGKKKFAPLYFLLQY